MSEAFSATTEASDEELLSPDQYAKSGYPHGAWARLRREDPVHWVSEWAGDPYWALTRHRDIVEVSKRPEDFANCEGHFLYPHAEASETGRNLLDMDPPEHRAYRGLVSKRFTPRAIAPIQERIDQITNEILDRLVTGDDIERIDFVVDVAAILPIRVVAELIGVPSSDWMKIFDWTNRAMGATDPEFQKGRSVAETRMSAMKEMFGYFADLAADRLKNPQNDVATDLARAQIDGEPIPPYELGSYFITVLAAGNETVRNATTGGLLALIENPEEFERVRREPDLVNDFVEEVLRFASPVIHMARTAVRDTEIGGKTIRAGQKVALFYPSANRDESLFEEPNRFKIDRKPNTHIAFGVGEHFCIGSHVARMELRAIFRHLSQRLEFVELDGPIERLRQNSTGGIKHLPIRYRLLPAS